MNAFIPTAKTVKKKKLKNIDLENINYVAVTV